MHGTRGAVRVIIKPKSRIWPKRSPDSPAFQAGMSASWSFRCACARPGVGHGGRDIISSSPLLAATTTKDMEHIPQALLFFQPKAMGILSLVRCGRNTVDITLRAVEHLSPPTLFSWHLPWWAPGMMNDTGEVMTTVHHVRQLVTVPWDGHRSPALLTVDNAPQDFT